MYELEAFHTRRHHSRNNTFLIKLHETFHIVWRKRLGGATVLLWQALRFCRMMADSGESKTVQQQCRRSVGGFLCKRSYSLYIVEGINTGQAYCAECN